MLPKEVIIREVGLRDGLQPEARFLPTPDKLKLARALVEAGLRELEATSFVSPKTVPQMADAAELIKALDQVPGVNYSALVVNLRGAREAIAAGLRELQFVVSCSEAHSRSNVRMSIGEALAQAAEISALAHASAVRVRTALSVVFGCPFEGEVPKDKVFAIIEKLQAEGVRHISLSDTAGLANPLQVGLLCQEAVHIFPGVGFSLHLHDTRGLALACIMAGLEKGITVIESSIGGLGGCPFIPQATGNVASEDLVYMLQAMGIRTGLDWQKLMGAAMLAERLLGRQLNSRQLTLARDRCQAHD